MSLKKLERSREVKQVKISLIYIFFAVILFQCHRKGIFVPPKLFEIKGFVETTGYAHGVWVDGNYAYIADGEAGLAIADVSDPFNPIIVGTWDLEGEEQDNAWNVYKHEGDTLLYLADYNGHIKIINVADPFNPQSTYFYVWTRYAQDVHGQVLRDTLFIYVAVKSGDYIGLRIFDASIPGLLVGRGGLETLTSAYGVSANGDFAYLAVGQGGLYIADCQDPNNLYWIGNVDTPGNARDIWVDNNIAYIADGSGGLQIIGVEDPSSPYIISSIELPGYARGVYAENDTVYIACGYGGLQIVDAREPLSPKIIDSIETDYAYGVFKKGDYIYLTTRAGLYVIGLKII